MWVAGLPLLSEAFSAAVDPITAFLTRNWAEVGGWSLFIGLAMLIVVGSFKEWWVPGGRHKRLEVAMEKALDTTQLLVKQNEQLLQVNPLTKILLDERAPRNRGNEGTVDPSNPGGS